uniref:Uncharacterized protein n=1 Tax=Caenorhabditis japonica TaxID=281687 RepID=A0A8R1EBM1_CAEJA
MTKTKGKVDLIPNQQFAIAIARQLAVQFNVDRSTDYKHTSDFCSLAGARFWQESDPFAIGDPAQLIVLNINDNLISYQFAIEKTEHLYGAKLVTHNSPFQILLDTFGKKKKYRMMNEKKEAMRKYCKKMYRKTDLDIYLFGKKFWKNVRVHFLAPNYQLALLFIEERLPLKTVDEWFRAQYVSIIN